MHCNDGRTEHCLERVCVGEPISTNGVLDELNSGGFAVFVQLYADEIYVPVVGQVLVAVEVGKGGG